MRIFIAVNFNNDTRSALLSLRNELRNRSERGSFSLPENLHLTLAFIGECNASETNAVKSAMSAVKLEPLDVVIDRVGRFKRDGGDIWWAGLRTSKPLLDLQRALTDKLATKGFELERREYKPHVTLGRGVVTEAAPWPIEHFGENVRKIDLMKSERLDGKLTYTAVHSVEADYAG